MILFLLFSFSLYAQTTVWAPAGETDGLWTTGANWSAGLPGDTTKVVFNVTTAADCNLDAAATIKQLVMGDNDSSAAVLIVNDGGSLTTTTGWSAVGYNNYAKLIVETGGAFTFGSHMWVGLIAGGNGVIEINGGTVNVTEMTGIGWDGGVGHVYVNSGVLNCAQFGDGSIKDGSLLDISGGSAVLTGDKESLVNGFIDADKITAYGGTGTVVVEVVEGNTVLTAVNGVPITFGNQLIFDGDNDYVDVGNGDAVNISGSELTLEAWIYATDWRTNVWEGCIINTESAPNNGYMIRAGANGTVNFNVGNSGWNEINTAEGAIELNKWHHIAATFNAGVQTIYIDGVEAVTADNSASTTTVGVATTNTAIGNWGNFANPGRSFLGTVHDVRIWNVARSAEEIAANKDIELTGSEEGLAGYWQLNEGTGQTVADLTGNQNGQLGSTDGQDENDPRWLGEVVIPALDVQPMEFLVFDGTSQYVNVGNSTPLDISGSAITLEALINMSEWRDEVWKGCILNKEQGGSGTDNGYMLRAGADGQLNFNLGSNSWNEINTEAGSLQLNKWHHVAATYDGYVQKLFIDGNLVAEAADTFAIASSNADLFIGSMQGDPNRTINGSLSQVRVWNVARTHQEIADNMNGDLVGDEAGLVGYWKLDEGEGQVAGGSSANAIEGQLGSTADVDNNDPAWGPVTVVRGPGEYLPEFPPTYFQGPFPFGSEEVRFDAPADKNAPTGDGVFHEYTAYRGTPNYDGDDGNLDEEEWNKIPWTLMQFNQEQGQSVYNFDSMLGWSGPEDHTAWFKMLHDDDHVYLAVMKVDDAHTYSDEAWDDTFYLWQCDAIQMQFDARAPGVFDDPMPQAEIGLGQIEGEDAYNYWEGGPGEPVINQQLELAPGSSQSSFASVFGKALHTNVGPHPEEDGLLLETIEATFLKWDDIMSDDDFAMMMSIITLDRDTVGTGRPGSDYFTVFEWGQGLFAKNRTDYASLVLSAGDAPTAIEDELHAPGQYTLKQNYPNPFNPTTRIEYGVAEADKVKISVFNVLGQLVEVLVDARHTAGTHFINFDASKYSSGVYFYKIEAGSFEKTRKMLLVK